MSKNETEKKKQSSKSDSAGQSQSTQGSQGSQGSANANDVVLTFDRALAEQRVYPAIDISRSNSRK